jgi:hypothetical protein
MKTPIRARIFAGLTIGAALWAMSGTAPAQIFVGNAFSNTIGEYTTNGVTVNASLVSGLDEPYGIAVVVPEPTTLALAGFGGLSLLLCLRRRK